MSIVVQYGSYTHDAGEVEYSIQKNAVLSSRNLVVGQTVSIQMNGMLLADSVSAMDAKVQSLVAAYSVPNQNWRVLNNGSPLAISINAEDTISGINVTQPPSFPTNKDAAYVTYLPYTIALAYEQFKIDELFSLKSFTESLQFSGGGPKIMHLETATGLPQKQIVRQNTIYRAVQSGQAVGMYREPVPPAPIWPNALVDTGNRGYTNGRVIGPIGAATQTERAVSWQYTFESATPLFGRPNIWGVTA